MILSQVFPLYVALFPPNHAYAVFGVFLVLTFWLYILGIVLVLGAELNAFLEQPARSVALAEATAAAERGRAEYDHETGTSKPNPAARRRDCRVADHSARRPARRRSKSLPSGSLVSATRSRMR